MKKVIYFFAVVVLAIGFVSCNNDDDHDFSSAEQNMELRAATLGFSDAEAYKTSVAEQCAAGNHENCDILNDGTHQPCIYSEHAGTRHDGTHHNGTGHGTHDPNTCTDPTHNHGTHDPNTCTDPTHNHGTHDPNTCTDPMHNHGTHDPNTCTDPTHNHGNNNGNHHNNNNSGGHHK
jgi:hypothetical protein